MRRQDTTCSKRATKTSPNSREIGANASPLNDMALVARMIASTQLRSHLHRTVSALAQVDEQKEGNDTSCDKERHNARAKAAVHERLFNTFTEDWRKSSNSSAAIGQSNWWG